MAGHEVDALCGVVALGAIDIRTTCDSRGKRAHRALVALDEAPDIVPEAPIPFACAVVPASHLLRQMTVWMEMCP